MNAQPLVAAAVFALFASAPAAAQTNIPVGQFRSIELNGGGRALVRYAPVQQVRILEGSAQVSDIYVSDQGRYRGRRHDNDRNEADRNEYGRSDGDRLIIDACRERCPQGYRLVVEIDTPDVGAVAVNGGGQIEFGPGFPRRGGFAAAVNGGGRVDARGIAAANASVAVNGGGDLLLGPSQRLAAAVTGGGRILYRGDPQLVTNVMGGGTVQRDDR